jgi:hypothetical protein
MSQESGTKNHSINLLNMALILTDYKTVIIFCFILEAFACHGSERV